MGLTSGFFIWLMIAVALGSVAATVWLWPRFAGQRPAMMAARLGLIAASQLLVLAAVLAFVNGYFAFFGLPEKLRKAVCRTARFSVTLIFTPANIASRRASTPHALASSTSCLWAIPTSIMRVSGCTEHPTRRSCSATQSLALPLLRRTFAGTARIKFSATVRSGSTAGCW